MPAWFSKVFKDAPQAAAPAATPEAAPTPIEVEEAYKPRRVIQAPVIAAETSAPTGDGIHIKAKADAYGGTITLMLDRPVLEGLSFWCPDQDTAYRHAPLAGAIFDLGGVASVLLFGANITITRDFSSKGPWEEAAKSFGAVVREHLENGKLILTPETEAQIPPEDEIRAALQKIIDEEINPGIAAHSGVISLTRVEGNTAFIQMGGGCQGCAASTITLRQGVESAFREACPGLGALLDETDHDAGTNPYFRELPTGMGA